MAIFGCSILCIILTTLLTFILFTITRLIVIPALKVKFYVKQGAINKFVPLLGQMGKNIKQTPITGDFLFPDKELVKKKS